jgi:pyruvate dehydrogenase E2 component (dihydrolipoamide acetyltransferase)
MPIDIKLPPSEGVDSADIAEMFVQEGDMIEKDQAICQVETGKATIDVPSPHAGKIVKIHVKAGQSVPVGSVLISVETGSGAAASAQPAAPPPSQAAPAPEPASTPAPAPERPQAQSQASAPAQVAPPSEAPTHAPARPAAPPARPAAPPQPAAPVAVAQRPAAAGSDDPAVPAGPAVRRFAREVGVDLKDVTGTGEGGRITRDDVLRVVREQNQRSHQTSAPSTNGAKAPAQSLAAPAHQAVAAPAPGVQHDNWGPVHIERMPKIRKTIANKMHESWTTVPRVTNFDDADVTELERIRNSSKDDYAKKGIKLTTMPFVLKSVAMALREHPTINASIDMANEQIIYKQYVSIGIAIDSERGLVVPSMRNVDDMSIPEIARGVAQLAENVRSGSFGIADLQGSTFTISNLGAIGGTYSTPIINTPEVAILLLGRTRPLPVVIDGKVEVRQMMPLSLSYDHRLVDGATAQRFLNDVIAYLKSPSRLLLAP